VKNCSISTLIHRPAVLTVQKLKGLEFDDGVVKNCSISTLIHITALLTVQKLKGLDDGVVKKCSISTLTHTPAFITHDYKEGKKERKRKRGTEQLEQQLKPLKQLDNKFFLFIVFAFLIL
jgi:hypothetical protein